MLIFNQNHKMAHEVHEEKIAYLHKYNIHVVVKIKKRVNRVDNQFYFLNKQT